MKFIYAHIWDLFCSSKSNQASLFSYSQCVKAIENKKVVQLYIIKLLKEQ